MKNYMKKNESGIITVEAALIMPMIVFILFALMYLSFYLHDKCRVQGIVDQILHKAELTVKHEADYSTGEIYYENISNRGVFYLPFGNTTMDEDNIRRYLQMKLESGLFLVKVTDIQVDVGKFNITISVKANLPISLPGVTNIWNANPDMIVEGKSQIHNPAETIRLSEVILDTGAKIKGVEALKEKLENIMK